LELGDGAHAAASAHRQNEGGVEIWALQKWRPRIRWSAATMVRLLFVVALASVMALPVAVAQVPSVFIDTKDIRAGNGSRFGAYEDNYLLLHRMQNNGWAESDEKAMRGHFSLRYVLFGWADKAGYVSYTGEFDFYRGSRPSGPVINRLSNPALHWSWALRKFLDDPADKSKVAEADAIDVGLEHESNGQVGEVTGAGDSATAQRVYAERGRPYFDQISRGSNFVSISARVSETPIGLPVSVQAKLRLYMGQDSDVTWGSLAGQGLKLSDYHRASVRISKAFDKLGLFEVQWTLGDKGLKTDSFEVGWQWLDKTGRQIPLYVRLHRGPLNTLSNYTQRQDSVGVGVRFSAF
jgi:outer membrane phospholipase A